MTPRLTNPILARATRMAALDVECMAEIIRRLNKFRFDPAYRGTNNRVPWRSFAKLCGVSRQHLYDLVKGDRKGLEPATRDRILTAIDLVLNKGVRWKRVVVRKTVAEVSYRIITPGKIEWVPIMPDGSPVPELPRRPLSARQLAAQQADRERKRAAAKDKAQRSVAP